VNAASLYGSGTAPLRCDRYEIVMLGAVDALWNLR
jgi:hypothetical protein